jgi:hypothetical protein
MKFFKYLLGYVAFFLSANLYAITCSAGIEKDLSVSSSVINSSQSYVCNNSCRYKLGFCVDVDIEQTSGICSATSTGEQCSGSNPDPIEQPTELTCTTDSCPNPNGLRCPSGYVSGTFNGEKICAKSKDKEPETECDPVLKDCSELRTDRIVEAIDNSNENIRNSITDMGDRLDGPLGSITQGLSDISEKLVAIADKIRSGGGSNPDPGGDGWDDVDTSPFNADVPFQDTQHKELDTTLFSSNDQCPTNNVLSLPNYNIHYEFNYSEICDFLNWFSYLVMIFAYIVSAYIVIKA